MSLRVEAARSLAPFTSLGLGGPAAAFAEAFDRPTVLEAVAYATAHALPLHVLGGGTNLVVSDAGVPGLVLRMATRGIRLVRDGESVLLTAEAGEPFSEVVAAAIDAGLAGLECLTGIPGSTGATPIQNVGAYGQEVRETVAAVEVLDRTTGEVRWLSASDCAFGYRHSRFKQDPARFLVLSVRFRLAPGAAAVRYAELARALDLRTRHAPSLREVADTVRTLRAEKSMLLDPTDPNGRSAGSFFMNPVVGAVDAERVKRTAVEAGLVASERHVPCFDAGPGLHKLAAGWLVEHAGIHKGLRRGAVGVSTKHALCLVHHGGGSTAQLQLLSDEIRDAVQHIFGVALTQEPVNWGPPLPLATTAPIAHESPP